ncbi:MAG: GDSL-type esterase/lipase family protein [Polyangiaceae bacterium]
MSLAACGESTHVSAPGRASEAAALPTFTRGTGGTEGAGADGSAVAVASPTPVPVAPTGCLTSPRALQRFFAHLAALDDRSAIHDVRIAWFGDSHTAADYETGPVRRALQSRFGDGGRGFVALGSPWKNYVQEGVRNVSSASWTTSKSRVSDGSPLGDGVFGLAGVALTSDVVGARLSTELLVDANEFEIAYMEHSAGGSFDVIVDGKRVDRVTTRGATRDGARHSTAKSWPIDPGPHRVDVRVVGDGSVRIFGMSSGVARNGLVLSALGINGARVSSPLGWNETSFAEDLRRADPHLVVLAYGTNEATDDTPLATHEKNLVDALGKIARAVPSASCLLVGPPDHSVSTRGGWSTPERLQAIAAVQKRVAEAAGCGFYSQLDAMGGPGSMARWASESPPRGGRDHVHLTKAGYAALANAFVHDLLLAYASWRLDEGLSPSTLGAPREGIAKEPKGTLRIDRGNGRRLGVHTSAVRAKKKVVEAR